MSTLKIPEGHPKKDELEKVAKTLLEFLPIHSLYISVENKDLGYEVVITILLSNGLEIDAPAIQPFVAKVFQPYPDFYFHLIEQEYALEYSEEGLPFYILHATRSELAYSSDTSNTIFDLKDYSVKKLIRRAKEDYAYYRTSVENCLGLIILYRWNDNYPQIAFLLHQGLQMLYIYFSKLTNGDYETSGDLLRLQNSFQSVQPRLENLFDVENEEEAAAIKQLNNALRAVKYNEEYEFTKEATELARIKTEKLLKEADTFFETYLKKCKKKIRAVRLQTNAENKNIQGNNNLKTETMEHYDNDAVAKFLDEIDNFRYAPTLRPVGQNEESYYAKVKFASYVELQYSVRDILIVAIHSLQNDGLENSGKVEDPASHLTRVLEIAVQLLPLNEIGLLDDCRNLLAKLDRAGQEKTSGR
ncbi:hypothetical protein LRS05_11305 [Flavobacterium sp. J372]|uniref:hypothetical protein n=1 Tax=Flavobacterium sp. J372 TaxID=2898436 RepID=UPI0021518921|nr:hypothetical protein [Flavobacterium sp. J372]MCR5862695.1 hypothetical protein [Flavobacterium sp. J372]